MDVLVIGYGKIGRMKSFLWQSLGRRVVVHDTDRKKVTQLTADGFEEYGGDSLLYNDLIVDISTPASYHLDSLKWALEALEALPRAILIEKPLSSTNEEMSALIELLKDEYPQAKDRIVVNESYYLSSALEYVANSIRQNSWKIQSLHGELSKNRLADVLGGRFIDPHLGALGIELPHMIALIQGLGIDIDNLAIKKVEVIRGGSDANNEGFRLELAHGVAPIVLESYLGDFRVTSSGPVFLDTEVIRCFNIVTNGFDYKIEFDPVEGIERYKSRVTVLDKAGNIHDRVVLDDNHLTSHLRKLHANRKDVLDQYLSVENALDISSLIFKLKERATYREVALAE